MTIPSHVCSTGADIVGVNCHLDPFCCLRTVKLMKEGLEKAGLKAHLMIQPLGCQTPECNLGGYTSLPEYPFGKHLLRCFELKGEETHHKHYLSIIHYIYILFFLSS